MSRMADTPRPFVGLVVILLFLLVLPLEAAVAGRAQVVHSPVARTLDKPPTKPRSKPDPSSKPKSKPNTYGGGKSNSDLCNMDYNEGDAGMDKATWINSGARDVLHDYLTKYGTGNWSTNFFKLYRAGGTMKNAGTSFDCTDMTNPEACPYPVEKDCHTWQYAGAFYVVEAMASLHAAFESLWSMFTQQAIEDISDTINSIVTDFGTPPKSSNDDIWSGLSMALYSLAGIFGTAEGMGGPGFLSLMSGPITILSQMASGAHLAQSDPSDPGALQLELTAAYGKMYTSLLQSLNKTVDGFFTGTGSHVLPGIGGEIGLTGMFVDLAEAASIEAAFQDGFWLDSKYLAGKVVELYFENTNNRMVSVSRYW